MSEKGTFLTQQGLIAISPVEPKPYDMPSTRIFDLTYEWDIRWGQEAMVPMGHAIIDPALSPEAPAPIAAGRRVEP